MPEIAAPPRTAAEVLTLGPAHSVEIARLTAGRRYTPAVLAAELADPQRYRWVGAPREGGRLAAVHRALRWGDYQFLKGVFADEDERGGDGALRLAFALRDMARGEPVRGIAAWISESSPAQLALARRLRLERTGSPLHLYSLPFAEASAFVAVAEPVAASEAAWRIEQILLSHHARQRDRAFVPDLLQQPGWAQGHKGHETSRALPDRDRLLLSSLPCTDTDELCALVAELAPAAAALGLSEAEFPVPAAEITLALWLASHKARRVTARPVYVGRSDFAIFRQEKW